MKSALVLGTALLAIVCAAGCGENPTAPTAATQAPFVGQFAGTWSGSLVLAPGGVSGGECVGADLNASLALGSSFDQNTVNVTQTATDVTAITRSATTGLSCQYAGTAALTSFALSSVSCDDKVLFQCSNGNPRVIRPVGSTLTATQSGDRAAGVVTTTYNIFFVDALNQEKPVAGMTTQQQFTATRR
jgi:hypothetical protein